MFNSNGLKAKLVDEVGVTFSLIYVIISLQKSQGCWFNGGVLPYFILIEEETPRLLYDLAIYMGYDFSKRFVCNMVCGCRWVGVKTSC